jgi:hypothetical protein
MTKENLSKLPLYSLEDETVKLVAYTIVSVKRGSERVMPGGRDQIIVTDDLTTEAFTAWMIGRYLQSKSYRDLKEEEKVRSEDRKYLRVYFVVSSRWPLEPLQFEERQLETLADLRDGIEVSCHE